MFHASILKRWYQDEVEFLKWIVNLRVVFKPVKRSCMQSKDLVAIARNLSCIGLAVIHVKGATVYLGSLSLEHTRRYCEEVARHWLRLEKGKMCAPILCVS